VDINWKSRILLSCDHGPDTIRLAFEGIRNIINLEGATARTARLYVKGSIGSVSYGVISYNFPAVRQNVETVITGPS